uniref:DUF659 domain-containing protein n=1 Tax=Lactuca sativa TaxID=4236 RepID=A0A9R1WXH2_LACSA|nr:hypothetical protein LSAT_V11C800442570 [Lactuca sativa]
MERSAVDLKTMRALCANGIPFNVLRNPQFRDMVNALRKAPEGYKVPSSEKAKTVLLDECVRDVEKDLIPFKQTWYSHIISIVSDRWSNIKHKQLLNVLVVNSRGSMFMYATKAIAQFQSQAIDSVDPSNVLSVVIDNATNYKVAGKKWKMCTSIFFGHHDYASEFIWLQDTYKKGKMIVKCFLNHGQALSIFMVTSKLVLLKVAETRFASHYRYWVKHDDEHTRKIGQLVVNYIRDDDFWVEVENILRITKPIYWLIKFCDSEGLKMGEIYENMDNMLGGIQDVMKENMYASYFPQVQQIKISIPLHCLGFALTPRFYDSRYLETLALGVMEEFNRISENRDEERLLREQFATFNMKKGLYSLPETQMDAFTMEAIDCWSTCGVETPELADVGKKLLSQAISSSSAKRNWSTYCYIHNVKRNRLTIKGMTNLFLYIQIFDLEESRLEDIEWEDLEEDEDNGHGKNKAWSSRLSYIFEGFVSSVGFVDFEILIIYASTRIYCLNDIEIWPQEMILFSQLVFNSMAKPMPIGVML